MEADYLQIDKIQITGDGTVDLIRDRKITDGLVGKLTEIVKSVNGTVTKEDDCVLITIKLKRNQLRIQHGIKRTKHRRIQNIRYGD